VAEAKPGRRLGLRNQVLLAAFECSKGDLKAEFTAEDLLLAAWTRDNSAWGLRGHENKHPDSERIYVELDRANVKGGMVGLGLFEKVRQRTYRLTSAGLVAAGEAARLAESPSTSAALAKAERALSDAVNAILSHPVFISWVKDQRSVKYFRDAGHFWGIAAGTPPGAIRSRILAVDATLRDAAALLDRRGTSHVGGTHGRALFEREDLQRAMEFQDVLKERFAGELRTLSVSLGD
jgi:hypothetical protein